MTTDLTISLSHRPGTLATASSTLGAAGIKVQGLCAYVCDGQGVFHVLVSDAVLARRALIDAGFDIVDERRVVVTPVENLPGAAAGVLRRMADLGVNIDLAYITLEGDLALGGDDMDGIARALR